MDLVHLQRAIALSLEEEDVKIDDDKTEDDLTKLLGGTHIYQAVYTLTQAGEQALAEQDRAGAVHVQRATAGSLEEEEDTNDCVEEDEEEVLRMAIAMSLAQGD